MKLFVVASIAAVATALPASQPPQAEARGVSVDLGGALLRRDADAPLERLPRGVSVDLGGALLRRDADAPFERLPRGVSVDLGGALLRRDANPEAPVAPDHSRATLRRHNAEENYAKRDDGPNLGVLDTVNSALAGVCQQIGGTMTTQTVCQTVSGSDI